MTGESGIISGELAALYAKDFHGYRLSQGPDPVLGHGGMGRVYRGLGPGGKTVAIKILRRDVHESHVEAELWISDVIRPVAETCPHLMRVITLGDAFGEKFIVLEYIDGLDLCELVAGQETVHTPTLLRIVRDICRALAALHRAGIVHRDVKPENILITPNQNGDPMGKLIDYGIACPMQTSQQSGGMKVGTPSIASPEQLAGHELDGRADIYSLGVALYEAICEEVPYAWAAPLGVLDTPACVWEAEIWQTIDPRVKDLVQWMIELNRERRPESAEVLAAAIEELLSELASATTSPPVVSMSNDRHMVPKTIKPLVPTTEPAPVEATSIQAAVPKVILTRRQGWWLLQLAMSAIALCALAVSIRASEGARQESSREATKLVFVPANESASIHPTSSSPPDAQPTPLICRSRSMDGLARTEQLSIDGTWIPDRGCWSRRAADKRRSKVCPSLERHFARHHKTPPPLFHEFCDR